ncbi:MAG: FAD-dependent oxidoreductase [Chloroflexi bacterium]|nr:FAD-dependent oxidoreductase [Chloroflexota bacterium]
MNTKQDIVIIGGGVIGVCAAYEMTKRGAQVTLIEQGEVASGSSYGNGGLIVPSHSVPLAAPGVPLQGLKWMLNPESPFYIKPHFDLGFIEWMIRFAFASRHGPMMRSIPILRDLLLASRVLFDHLASEVGFEFGYEQKGTLMVYLTPRALEGGVEEAHLVGRFGIETKILNSAELHKLEPALLPEVIGGIQYLQDAHLDPARFVTGLAEKAQELGVRIQTKTEVLGFETSNFRITRIHTTRGDFPAEQVILAAGSWSPAVMRDLKIKLPVQAAKGYSITLERPQVSPRIPLMFGEARVVVTPLGDRLRLAGTLELAGMDLSINQRRVAAIQENSAKYLPGLERAKVLEIWRGLRPCTPDGLPVIGRVKAFDNLIIATGHAMLGISLGPITGELVSQVAMGEKPEIELSPLKLERF